MTRKDVYVMEAEPQLLQQAANGSRDAYAILYKHYLPKLYKYLNEILRSKEDTEEILQDIFLKIWEKKEELTEVKVFGGFLFRIARNKLMNRYDHQKVQRKAINYIGQHKQELSDTIEDQYIYIQYNQLVQKAISSLPPKRRLVFDMSTQQELSLDEIATELNISKSMVKKQLYTATNYVKEYLRSNAELTISIALAFAILLSQ